MGNRTVHRVVSDNPGAIPQDGESGTIYEYEVWEDGYKLASFYDERYARELASEPKLLEACKQLRNMVRAFSVVPDPKENSMGWDIWNECLAAIAKTEGK